MTQKIINIGSSPNKGDGDPLRTAFGKINDNFTELYETDTSTRYHLGDETQFVTIELDGENVPTGAITIQSGYDTTMPVYIKGGNCSQDGVGGNVVIEAGAPPLATPEQLIEGAGPYAGTVGDIEMSANQTTIESLGNIWTFGSNGVFSLPELQGGSLFIQGPEIGSTTSSIAISATDDILLRADVLASSKLWGLSKYGQLSLPDRFPIGFTAVFDSDHYVEGVTEFTGDGTFQLGIELQGQGTEFAWLSDDPVYSSAHGYQGGEVFEYREEDHGIPNYILQITLLGVTEDNGDYALNVAFTPPPALKDLAKLVSGDELIIRVGESAWMFDYQGNLYLPASGDIKDVNGDSVLGGGGANTGDIVFSDTQMSSPEGSNLVLATTTADNDYNVITLAQKSLDLLLQNNTSNNYINLSFDNSLEYPYALVVVGLNGNGVTWKFNHLGDLILPDGGTIRNTLDEDLLAGGSSNTGQWSFNNDTAYNATGNGLYIQSNQGSGDGSIYLPYENESTNLNIRNDSGAGIELSINGTTNWTFGTDGNLTIPNDILANPSNDMNLKVFDPGVEGAGVAISLQNRNADSGSKTTQFNVNPNNIELITDFQGAGNTWTFGADGILSVPGADGQIQSQDGSNFLSLPNDSSYQTNLWGGGTGGLGLFGGNNTWIILDDSNNGKTNKVEILTDRNVTNKSWTFDGDGALTFPDTTVQTTAYQTTSAPGSSKGVSGNKAGMVAFDNDNFYYCKQDYTDGVDDIWVKTAWTSTSW